MDQPETPPPAVTPSSEPSAAEPLATAQMQPGGETDKDQSRVAPATLPTERAYLIVTKNPTDDQEKRFSGTAMWSLAGTGVKTSLAVVANIPEWSADFSLVIRANTDRSLPASHTIDVLYRGPDDPDGPITDIAGFMVRTEGGDSSVPLRGAGALVVPGQYMFGLSGAPADRANNTSLLKSAGWIVVPTEFQSKRKSVFVIEIGDSGAAALAKAFAAWGEKQEPAQSQ